MARTLWGDDERYLKTYWDVIPDVYFTGDGARCDEDGYFGVVGRIDDVLNVSGHRIGTAEIESALVADTKVAEAAVVGYPHDIKAACRGMPQGETRRIPCECRARLNDPHDPSPHAQLA
jgi:acetyl-CoA synthetase